MTSKDIIFGAVVVVVATCLSWLLITHNVTGNGSSPTLGAAGNLQAENYIPYVRINGGYSSAMPIVTTSTFGAGATTLTGALIGTSGAFSSTGSFGGLLTTDAGELHSYSSATSTSLSITMTAADFTAYDTVLLTPIVGSITLTFPASTTLSTWLPNAGDTQRTCFVNGTTTAAIALTFAGGLGTNLQVASSSATALGSTKLYPQKVGCFTFIRGNTTASTNDILAAYVAYQ